MHDLIKRIWNNKIQLWSNVLTCATPFRGKPYKSVTLISKTIAKDAVLIRGGTYLMKSSYKKKYGMRYASSFNSSSLGH